MRTDITAAIQSVNTTKRDRAMSLLLRVDSCVLARCGVMLAGGAVRDLYFGNRIKDYDLSFYRTTPLEMREALRQFIDRSPHTVEVEEHTGYDGGDERIPLVIKVTEYGAGDTIICSDWILYTANTREEVLESFDHSINAFCMYYDDEFRMHAEHHGEWGVCTRNLNADCSAEREERFREFARANGWEYK